ncbi:TetR/AcrR family transcriptional regulator [Pseudonocardiaceae bacterium YIM PH 21723]|nr:TetR/AcrR family transcriptional regulator [Pseudonocardiaceae bacterium YIM PH 21723]
MATGRPRRLEYSESTRKALVDSAVELFTRRGYSSTSLDEVAQRARVTKGALYHHFGGKQALFEAAFDQVESGVVAKLAKVAEDPGEPWEIVQRGIKTFLRVCLEPTYQRIVVHEAPVVMGWERWREAEKHYSYGIIQELIMTLVETGELRPLPVQAMVDVFYGGLSSAATVIATSDDPRKASADVGTVMNTILDSLRTSPGEPRVVPPTSLRDAVRQSVHAVKTALTEHDS